MMMAEETYTELFSNSLYFLPQERVFMNFKTLVTKSNNKFSKGILFGNRLLHKN